MKPKNPNPFYMVYQSFWTELRLKGAVKEVFAVIYGRCAYSGNAAEIQITAEKQLIEDEERNTIL